MADISNKRKQRNNKKRKISKTSTSPPEKKTLEIVKKPKTLEIVKKPKNHQNPEKKKKKKQELIERVDDSSRNEVVESEAERVQKLLEPYTKEQLIDFLCDAAVSNSSLFERIKNTADQDVSHRKIFVHGLGWDTTQETLKSVFQSYGEIEECRLVLDRITGKAKGYGFVLFKSRNSAAKALKDPQKKINNRVASCQLASIGPVTANQTQDNSWRKIYVSNVHTDADPQKLRSFFAKFGEIEMGPLGFDMLTGKSRGFALFLYKTLEGAKKVLEEPYKMFEGHQMHCQKASENKNKASMQQQQPQPTQPPVLAAVAAAQNLAIFNQHPSLNPMYSGLVANPNPGFIPGSVNPMMVGAMNQSLIASHQMPASSFGLGLGGYSGFGGYGASHGLGILGGNPSLLGAQAPANPAFQGSSMNPAFPGLQSYQNSTMGQSSSAARTYGATGSLSGYPSYMW